jgi:porphobilinogen synthase
MAPIPRKLRRLRAHPALREMLAGVRLCRQELIAPMFVCQATGVRREIPSMPGQYQLSVDAALEDATELHRLGLRAVLLFGIPQRKDAAGSGAWDDNGAVQQLCSRIKQRLPDMLVITDVCLCEYTSDGQCGVVTTRGGDVHVDNDSTLPLLARTAVSHARAGADVVAPSAMMDAQVAAIRAALDEADLGATAIMGYSVKFASCLYGPFRDAAGSAPSRGDRRGYQMDYRAPSQALPEALADAAEGADMLMVKPAATYLDVISRVRQATDLPLAAFHVSGEYAMLCAAAANGWLDRKQAVMEVTSAIKRAGADMIITYFARELAGWL